MCLGMVRQGLILTRRRCFWTSGRLCRHPCITFGIVQTPQIHPTPKVTSAIEAAEGKLAQTKEDLKSAQDDRASAKSAMAEATALREKEAASFAAEKACTFPGVLSAFVDEGHSLYWVMCVAFLLRRNGRHLIVAWLATSLDRVPLTVCDDVRMSIRLGGSQERP